MKLLVSIVVPITIFFVVWNFLDYSSSMSGDEILIFAGELSFISLVISIYTLNTRQSIENTASYVLSTIKNLMDSINIEPLANGLGYWWSLWLPYFSVALGFYIAYTFFSNMYFSSIIMMIVTLIFSIILSIKDRRRRKKSNLGFTKLAIVPAVICSIYLVFILIFFVYISIYGFPRFH